MDISEMRREADAYRKRKQDAELAEMQAKVDALKVTSKQLDVEFMQLAEVSYSMTLLMMSLSRRSRHAALLTWVFAILTKASLLMIEEGNQHVA